MTQNIYDNDEFFAGYRQLRRSEEGLAGAPEWPTLQAMLPDLKGRRVLDLGCGFGWFCRWALAQDAASVVGIDVSQNMLAHAKETSDAAIRFVRADLDTLRLEPGTFDLVYSSLAFHYLMNLDLCMVEVAAALVPGGHFVFSVEHPLFTASREPAWWHAADGRKSPVRPVWRCSRGKRTAAMKPKRRDWSQRSKSPLHSSFLLLRYCLSILGSGTVWGRGRKCLSIKPDAEAVHLSPNYSTALHVAIPAQFKFLGYGYRTLHIERGASSGNIAHGAVDDRAALVKDNFSSFENSTPVAGSLVCDRFVVPHCNYCPLISPFSALPMIPIRQPYQKFPKTWE